MRRKKETIKIITILMTMLIVASLPITAFGDSTADNKNIYYLGEPVLTDNGFAGSDKIESGDPHYGWILGNFYLTGYTSKTEDGDTPIFLKTVGDTVSLWFKLEQDINSLNGEENLVISEDNNGFDEGFQIEKTNFGRGTLIIRKTDYQNKTAKPQIYTDYLSGINAGADTKIDVYEEGDYVVALDYEIRNKKLNPFGITLFSTYTHYSIRYRFSVRNGNCMVFPFDTKSKDELTNKSITENGFYLDLAKSRYLDINIKKQVLKEGSDGLTEDVRFNKPAKEGDHYTDEGIYIITVKNKYTNEETVKKIYVGTNNVLKAYITTGYSIRDIEDLIKAGAVVDENGFITLPKNVEEPKVVEDMPNTEVVSNETKVQNAESPEKQNIEIGAINGLKSITIEIGVAGLIVIIILILLITKHRKKIHNKTVTEEEPENIKE